MWKIRWITNANNITIAIDAALVDNYYAIVCISETFIAMYGEETYCLFCTSKERTKLKQLGKK